MKSVLFQLSLLMQSRVRYLHCTDTMIHTDMDPQDTVEVPSTFQPYSSLALCTLESVCIFLLS